MSERNIIKEIAAEVGVELLPREQWTDEQKIGFDTLVYGTGFGRLRPDGTIEHIPTQDVLVYRNGSKSPNPPR